MSEQGILSVDMICPLCGKKILAEIYLTLVEAAPVSYKLGDKIRWIQPESTNPAIRPGSNRADFDSQVNCPLCRRAFPVSTVIQEDILRSVELDFNRCGYKHERPVTEPKRWGKITFSGVWQLTEKRVAAMLCLVELGADVYSSSRIASSRIDYTVVFSNKLAYSQYVEIGYLLAQLGDDDFPLGYKSLSVSQSKWEFLERRDGETSVYYSESFPTAHRYRVVVKKTTAQSESAG